MTQQLKHKRAKATPYRVINTPQGKIDEASSNTRSISSTEAVSSTVPDHDTTPASALAPVKERGKKISLDDY